MAVEVPVLAVVPPVLPIPDIGTVTPDVSASETMSPVLSSSSSSVV